MTYKMYLMSISGLEEECLQKDAMCLLDSCRKELVHKYKKEKDRMRAIVAGLLLQAGFLEMNPAEVCVREVLMPGGQCFILNGSAFVEYLKEVAKKEADKFPIELIYEKGEHGKPFWNQELMREKLAGSSWPDKKLWHFNLSHSGDYVVLVVADVEVGVDIQEAREVKSFFGGYKAFSRMEAFVKCTGDGYVKGHSIYDKYHGVVPGYEIQSMHIIDQYALNVCFDVGNKCGMEQNEKVCFYIRKDKL